MTEEKKIKITTYIFIANIYNNLSLFITAAATFTCMYSLCIIIINNNR